MKKLFTITLIAGMAGLLSAQQAEVEREVKVTKDTTEVMVNVSNDRVDVSHEVTVTRNDTMQVRVLNQVRVKNAGDTTQVRTQLQKRLRLRDEDGDGIPDSLQLRKRIRENKKVERKERSQKPEIPNMERNKYRGRN
ncbi:MAG: hypothetical protein DRQ03_02125 [Candidatus Hydrothermota bacterium]|nr:MAG: hypothetical protein DRQ03_02125 [Candidatus Hydrothermae bacterium]